MSDEIDSAPATEEVLEDLGESPSPVPLAKIAYTAATVVVPVAAYFVIPFDGELGRVFALILVIAAACALIPLSIHQAGLVLRSDHPLFDAARCIVTGLVVLIVSFSSAYYVLGTEFDDQIVDLHTKLDGLYFTITIMATVGFGDISASGQMARAVVTGHMIVNFGLVAVGLRVVSWALRERQGPSLQQRLDQRPRARRAAAAAKSAPPG